MGPWPGVFSTRWSRKMWWQLSPNTRYVFSCCALAFMRTRLKTICDNSTLVQVMLGVVRQIPKPCDCSWTDLVLGRCLAGDYKVTLYVAMTQLPIFVNNTDTIYLRILPATLFVELIGGHTKMFSLSDTTVTFVAEAYDTLFPQYGIQDINFKWFCADYTGTTPTHDFTTTAAMSCLTLTDADTNGTHLWIPSSALTAGTTIYVAVYVEKLDRLSSETDQLGELVSDEVLEIEIWWVNPQTCAISVVFFHNAC